MWTLPTTSSPIQAPRTVTAASPAARTRGRAGAVEPSAMGSNGAGSNGVGSNGAGARLREAAGEGDCEGRRKGWRDGRRKR
ncbi:hypothetical protein GCM10009577_84610 [Streptomyces javensis]